MKKTIALAIALMMALTLAACGGNSNTPDGGNTTPPASTPSGNTNTPAPMPTDNPQPSETPGGTEGTSDPAPALTAEAGGIIRFGGYEWLVLDVQDGKALIISVNVLEEQKYDDSSSLDIITWENSSIRQYLNGGFFNNFNETDKARIIETTVINEDNPDYGVPGGNDTTDRIFFLSISEANTYFADDSARIALKVNGNAGSWMLRSPGCNNFTAAYIRSDGSVYVYDAFHTQRSNNGVRPAMWITLP